MINDTVSRKFKEDKVILLVDTNSTIRTFSSHYYVFIKILQQINCKGSFYFGQKCGLLSEKMNSEIMSVKQFEENVLNEVGVTRFQSFYEKMSDSNLETEQYSLIILTNRCIEDNSENFKFKRILIVYVNSDPPINLKFKYNGVDRVSGIFIQIKNNKLRKIVQVPNTCKNLIYMHTFFCIPHPKHSNETWKDFIELISEQRRGKEFDLGTYNKLQRFYNVYIRPAKKETRSLPPINDKLTAFMVHCAFKNKQKQSYEKYDVQLQNHLFNNKSAKKAMVKRNTFDFLPSIDIDFRKANYVVANDCISEDCLSCDVTYIHIHGGYYYELFQPAANLVETETEYTLLENPLFYRTLFQHGLQCRKRIHPKTLQTLFDNGYTSSLSKGIKGIFISVFSELCVLRFRLNYPNSVQQIVLQNCKNIVHTLLIEKNVILETTIYYFYLAFLLELYNSPNEHERKCAVASVKLVLEYCPVFIPKQYFDYSKVLQSDLFVYDLFLRIANTSMIAGLNAIDPLYLTNLLEIIDPNRTLTIWSKMSKLYSKYCNFIVNKLKKSNTDKTKKHLQILLKMFRSQECREFSKNVDCNDRQYQWHVTGDKLLLFSDDTLYKRFITIPTIIEGSKNPLYLLGKLIEWQTFPITVLLKSIMQKIPNLGDGQHIKVHEIQNTDVPYNLDITGTYPQAYEVMYSEKDFDSKEDFHIWETPVVPMENSAKQIKPISHRVIVDLDEFVQMVNIELGLEQKIQNMLRDAWSTIKTLNYSTMVGSYDTDDHYMDDNTKKEYKIFLQNHSKYNMFMKELNANWSVLCMDISNKINLAVDKIFETTSFIDDCDLKEIDEESSTNDVKQIRFYLTKTYRPGDTSIFFECLNLPLNKSITCNTLFFVDTIQQCTISNILIDNVSLYEIIKKSAIAKKQTSSPYTQIVDISKLLGMMENYPLYNCVNMIKKMMRKTFRNTGEIKLASPANMLPYYETRTLDKVFYINVNSEKLYNVIETISQKYKLLYSQIREESGSIIAELTMISK